MARSLALLALLAACSHAGARPQAKNLAVRIDAPESPLLRSFTANLVRHGVRISGDKQDDALDLSLHYDQGFEPTPSFRLPRDGQVTLEVRKDGKLLQTLESPDSFCFLKTGTLREFYACHAERLSYDFLGSDAARELPGGPPPAAPDGGS